VVDRALATFMQDGERISFAAEMVCEAGGPVTALLTQWRLVIIESRLIWATPIHRVKVADVAGSALEVRLLAETVSDSLVLGGGLATLGRGERRMTLRSGADPAAGVRLRGHLLDAGAGLLSAGPATE
jgi:hypothetical protein